MIPIETHYKTKGEKKRKIEWRKKQPCLGKKEKRSEKGSQIQWMSPIDYPCAFISLIVSHLSVSAVSFVYRLTHKSIDIGKHIVKDDGSVLGFSPPFSFFPKTKNKNKTK